MVARLGKLWVLSWSALFVVVCVSRGSAAAAESAPAREAPILRAPRGYLNVSPAGVTLMSFCGPLCYTWGIDVGVHIPRFQRFALQAGGFFTHVVARHPQHFSAGTMLRVGGGNDRVFGYGLARVGAAIVHTTVRDTEAFLYTSFGAGVMSAVHRRVTLGGEVSVDMIISGDYYTLCLRAFVGFLF